MTSAFPVPESPIATLRIAAHLCCIPIRARALNSVASTEHSCGFTMAAASATMAVSGLAGSSLAGKKLAMPAKSVSMRAPSRVGAVTAKYGESSVYFDLGDINNTTGNWDLYGNDDPARYNKWQNTFFETFASGFTKRGLLLKFLVLGGATTIGYLGSTASAELLAIKKGPQQSPIMGPRGRK